MVCQVSTASPKETCSSWGSFQTPGDNTVAVLLGWRDTGVGCLSLQNPSMCSPAVPKLLHSISGPLGLFTERQQLLLTCIHEKQSQKLPPTAPEQVFHLQPVCSHCRGPGDDFYGGQALQCSYCRDGEALSQLEMLCSSQYSPPEGNKSPVGSALELRPCS